MINISFAFQDRDQDISDILEDLRLMVGLERRDGVSEPPEVRSGQLWGVLHELTDACLALPTYSSQDLRRVLKTLMDIVEHCQSRVDRRYLKVRERVYQSICKLMHEGVFTGRQIPGYAVDNFCVLLVFFTRCEHAPTKEPERRWVADYFGWAHGVVNNLDAPPSWEGT